MMLEVLAESALRSIAREAAVITRQQLQRGQAILAKLGVPRATSFCGVTPGPKRRLHGPVRQQFGGMVDRSGRQLGVPILAEELERRKPHQREENDHGRF